MLHSREGHVGYVVQGVVGIIQLVLPNDVCLTKSNYLQVAFKDQVYEWEQILVKWLALYRQQMESAYHLDPAWACDEADGIESINIVTNLL